MRTGIAIHLSPSDRKRLRAVIDDRNSRKKHVWRNVTGGSGDDTLTGDSQANVLSGSVGDDVGTYVYPRFERITRQVGHSAHAG